MIEQPADEKTYRTKDSEIAAPMGQIVLFGADFSPRGPGFPTFLALHAATARMMFSPRIFSVTQHRTAVIPRSRNCFTPVFRSSSDIGDSTPERHCRTTVKTVPKSVIEKCTTLAGSYSPSGGWPNGDQGGTHGQRPPKRTGALPRR
jgi:hypothetical protein